MMTMGQILFCVFSYKQEWLLYFKAVWKLASSSSCEVCATLFSLLLLFRRFYLYSYSLHWLKLTYCRCVVSFGPVSCGPSSVSIQNYAHSQIHPIIYANTAACCWFIKILKSAQNVIVNLHIMMKFIIQEI